MKQHFPKIKRLAVTALISAVFVSACDDKQNDKSSADTAFASQYQAQENHPVIIQNATLLTATGEQLEGASIYFKDGKIVAVGQDVDMPSDDNIVVIDGKGKWVTPGIIDVHSHLGVSVLLVFLFQACQFLSLHQLLPCQTFQPSMH